MSYKIGHGIDIHQLKSGIPLILGGIHIKSELGIVGHSDGDVVIHALVDAILGALALGDIGTLFPSNNKWKNSKSSVFLHETINIMKKEKYNVVNLDINIILENPRINLYILSMRKSLGQLMKINYNNISIKANTSDALGYIGREEGIMATATILLIKRNEG
tara:strand:+ start:988 stop:1473 length:486 start_codon:yes stop_codon:yes gene_type:complete